jgi:TM2 domain-containing membrane protein YozV
MPPEAAALKEPPFVLPHHYSDIDYWRYPERNFYVFIGLSFFLGFFGLDHFYLRSFSTAIQKFIFNLFTFGMWYFWDLVQIVNDSKKVRAEGLTSPFDWIRGIGRGVFIDPVQKAEDEKDPSASVIRTKKDFVVYALLTIFCGLFGIDKFYVGLPWEGLTKFFTCFFPLTFLFGWMWVFYDIMHAVIYPDSVVHGAISTPPPYNLFFGSGLSGEPLFMPERVSKTQLAKEMAGVGGQGSGQGSGGMDTFRFLYRELAVPLLQPTVGTAIQQVSHGAAVADKAVTVGKELVGTVPKVAAAVTEQVEAVTNPDRLMGQIQAAAAAKAATASAAAAVTGTGQKGGGSSRSSGSSSSSSRSGPIIAGTLSAVVIAGAVKVISELLSDKKR